MSVGVREWDLPEGWREAAIHFIKYVTEGPLCMTLEVALAGDPRFHASTTRFHERRDSTKLGNTGLFLIH